MLGALDLGSDAGLAARGTVGPLECALWARRAPACRVQRPGQVGRPAEREVAVTVAFGAERRQHLGQSLAGEMDAKRPDHGERAGTGRGVGQRQAPGHVHRQGALEPRQPLEALGDEAGQRVERGDEDGDVLERRAGEHSARDPVGSRLHLFLDSRVLLEVHGAVRPVAPRPGRVGEERRVLEEVGCQEVALARVRSRGSRCTQGLCGLLSKERSHPVEIAGSDRAAREHRERCRRDRADEAGLRAREVNGGRGEGGAGEGPQPGGRLERSCRLADHAGARPGGPGGFVDRPPDASHIAEAPGRSRGRGLRVELVGPQVRRFEIADGSGERFVPARPRPE